MVYWWLKEKILSRNTDEKAEEQRRKQPVRE
jgi:hypothetical protein